ncbi:hypothetical protein GCM10007103_31640 [Salinimicrobium marinum]|uniref:Uncharacterized protein n=1 Tax=Salinimicrobium marinum TaxID=680283 RepID=A0A918SLF2_9FLAO|nr:hypothetical protein [Salinimicrobium marinum]GHA48432.1 hypothetical protein GCM10007103_31640 [Salinimicrobium marinum]
MKYLFIVFLFLLSFQQQTEAQEKITGSIAGWQQGEAKIMFIDMFSGCMRELGSIDAEGNFEIPLEKDFFTSVKAAMQKEQEKAAENGTISLKDLQGTFSCDKGKPEYINPETKLTSLPQHLMVARVKGEKELLGMLSPVSNPVIAKWLLSYKQENTGKGKYFEWVYLEDEAAVKGSCYSHGFTNNDVIEQHHEFDMDLKKGWNMVQHEILEIFEDEQGKIIPEQIEITTITEVPEDVQWIFVPSKKK